MIPNIVEQALSGRGPFFITGDPKKDYSFAFMLLDLTFKLGSVNSFFSELNMLYISNLAEKVTLPAEKFDLTLVQIGVVQSQFPKGVTISNLSVSYLEDELDSVYKFHRTWQDSIRAVPNGTFLLSDGQGMTFRELGKVCSSAIFSPTRKIPPGSWLGEIPGAISSILSFGQSSSGEMPLGLEIFPNIFPIQVDRVAADKAGSGIAKTTVTYARIPEIKNGTYNEWAPPGDGSFALSKSFSIPAFPAPVVPGLSPFS